MRCAFGQTLPDRTPLELLKIFVAWRKNDTGFALSVLFDKGPAIGLHRPVEGIELRVLAETFGIDAGRLRIGVGPDNLRLLVRSEEHTSELQSLMRISYAVFCLKKKKIE